MNTSKTSHGGFVNQFMVYALVTICTGASIGLGTVWMRHQISITANENKVLETAIADVERKISATNAAIAAEQDPAVLAQKNTQWSLGLAMPAEGQVRRIGEDPVARMSAMQNRKIFGDGPATINLRVALAR
jgi:hypothetical protein